jgi:hypothetical protein
MIRQSQLINAIEEYRLQNGKYPDLLTDLVPNYISNIPGTGMCGYPTFEYEKATR